MQNDPASAPLNQVRSDTPPVGDDATLPYLGNRESLPTKPEATLGQVGNYDLLRKIAEGGMGVVYLARQRGLNRHVALKMTLGGQLSTVEERLRFCSEAESAGRLQHPHIVPIFEVGEHAGRPYFSMGYIEGPSLKASLLDGPMAPVPAARLLGKVARAVEYAHSRGIIHRDLKPANILIDSRGEPHVTDFGLAKQTATDSGLTATGQILGTPSFMPPEQARGDMAAVGPALDVYSLGATLYCALTGRPPFQAATIVETVHQVLTQDPVAPRQLNPLIPRDLDTICLKALSKSAAQRYASAAEFADDLDRWLAGSPIRARRASLLERAVKWSRRHPWPAGLLATAAVLITGITVYLETRPAQLHLKVQPEGAVVLLEGRSIPLREGQAHLEIPPGRKVLETSASGFVADRREVVLARGRENGIQLTISLAPALGYLQIDTDPPGATATVFDRGGKEVASGPTPFHTAVLPSGAHRVKLAKDLYVTQTLAVEIPTDHRVASLSSVKLKPRSKYAESYRQFQARRDALQRPLAQPIRLENVPLDAAIKQIAKENGFQVVFDRGSLDEERIPLTMPVSLEIQGVTFEVALSALLGQVRKLDYVPVASDSGTILRFGSQYRLRDRIETVLFPANDLVPLDNLARPTNEINQILETIEKQVAPTTWDDVGGPGRMQLVEGTSLSVFQSWNVMLLVDKHLQDLRALRANAGGPATRQEATLTQTFAPAAPRTLATRATPPDMNSESWGPWEDLIDEAAWIEDRPPTAGPRRVGNTVSVREGMIEFSGYPAYYGGGLLSNFQLQAQCAVRRESTVRFRLPYADASGGYTFTLLPGGERPSGVINELVATPDEGRPDLGKDDDEWFDLDVVAIGSVLQVRVGGEVRTLLSDYAGAQSHSLFRTGALAVQGTLKLREARLRRVQGQNQDELRQVTCVTLLDAIPEEFERWSRMNLPGRVPTQLKSLSVRQTPAGPRFTAVILRDGDNRRAFSYHGATLELDEERMRLLQVAHFTPELRLCYRDHGEVRYAGLFRELTPGRLSEWSSYQRAKSWTELMQRTAKSPSGLTPASVHVLENPESGLQGDETQIAEATAVLRRSFGRIYMAPVAPSECAARLDPERKSGKQPVFVHAWNSSSGPKLGLILANNRNQTEFESGIPQVEMDETLSRQRTRGRYPHSLTAYEQDGQLRFAAVWMPCEINALRDAQDSPVK